ncbi:MAG: sensor histidine kinase [Clostridia bacterium]|nr:sensor histidine kinase [Clostridia bacterium]
MSRFGAVNYFIRIIRDIPIRSKLTLSFLLLIIFPVMLIGLFSFQRSSELLKHKTEQYTKDVLMETSNNIEVKLREIERLSFQVVYNQDIQRALKAANHGGINDEYEKIATERIINMLLSGLISSSADVAAIQVVSNSGVPYSVNPASIAFTAKEEDKTILDQGEGSAVWFDTDHETQTMVVGRAINSHENLARIGYVFIYLRESSLYDIYKKTELFKSGELFLISRTGRVVSSKDKEILGTMKGMPKTGLNLYTLEENFVTAKVDRKNYYITFRAIEGTNWRIISFIPAVEVEKDIIWLRNWTILICASTCLLALIVSVAISDSISKPVRRLSKMMLKVGGGDFSVLSSYESKDEIGILSSHFNKMVSQVQQLIQEVYQEQLLKQKAELKSLRMQINPHFLYNTLESINWMARTKGVPDIGKMVKALGDLMRSSISGDDFVSIEEEMKNINNYLTIQKFRYGDRFDVVTDIDPEIAMIKIPKLILQPIVENAIVHGIEEMVGNGRIEIKGALENQKVVLQVKDNGIGMDESQILELLSQKDNARQTEGHTHIGLRNVDRRVKMYYGQDYGLFIESSPGCGANVKILLSQDISFNAS